MKPEAYSPAGPSDVVLNTQQQAEALLASVMNPRSVAVIGASADANKVGGRPIDFMLKHGYDGAIYPVNPTRTQVQGLPCYSSIEALPQVPDMAIIAVPADRAVSAVKACASQGTSVAVVLTSGFGETGQGGLAAQNEMLRAARESGMRLLGPNCQGVTNFSCGLVANFSTAFHEVPPMDGPVAIISQSGATSQVIYNHIRSQGLGVRYVHATGNEADLTAADLLAAVIEDPEVQVVLLYLESVTQPQMLAAAAERARRRGLPIIAVKSGRSARGQAAARSHTGAMVSEDAVVDAFMRRHAIQRVRSLHELTCTVRWHVERHRPLSDTMFFVSNSGASCVMAADHADYINLSIPEIPSECAGLLRDILPAHCSVSNPLDITTALLENPKSLQQTLAVTCQHLTSDFTLVSLPVVGSGYDMRAISKDIADYRDRCNHPVAVVALHPDLRTACATHGLAVFRNENEAMEAFHLLLGQAALQRQPAPPVLSLQPAPEVPHSEERFFNESDSLQLLARTGIDVVEHYLCPDASAVASAMHAIGDKVAIKGCSADIPHKTEMGLVALNIETIDEAQQHFTEQRSRICAAGLRFDGVLVARMMPGGVELALGARVDPVFGPVVLIGAGGIHIEEQADFALLIAPFTEEDVLQALGKLRVYSILSGARGNAARDLSTVAKHAVKLGEAMLSWQGEVASIDINPLLVYAEGQGAVAIDCLIEQGNNTRNT